MSAPVCIANAVADAIGRRRRRAAADPAARVGAAPDNARGSEPQSPERSREARRLRVRRRALARGGARRAAARRRGREADRRRAEPRPRAQHAPRPPHAARRPQPRGPRRDRGGRGSSGSVPRCGRPRSSTIRAPIRCCARRFPYVGHFVTRNRGTIGGSVAHADGAAEIPLCLAALGGTVVVDGPGRAPGDRDRTTSSSRTT